MWLPASSHTLPGFTPIPTHTHSLAAAENLLIDAQGYLKMVDFGFAKVVRDRTYTVCGTPEYLAPELVLGKAHGPGVDYWALGILLFEQVAGFSPFCDAKGSDQMVICRNILKQAEPEFPAHVKDRDCKDLILRACRQTSVAGAAASPLTFLGPTRTHAPSHAAPHHNTHHAPRTPPSPPPLRRPADQGRQQAPGVHGGGRCRGEGAPLFPPRGLAGAARQAPPRALAAHAAQRPCMPTTLR